MPNQIYLSVVVPAYKQEKTIRQDLEQINSVLSRLGKSYEIICVVDGILDKTFDLAKTVSGKYAHIKILSYQKNQGKGYAVRYGMSKSRGEIVAFLDAGMDIKAEGLLTLVDYLEKEQADIVVGSKKHPKSKVSYSWQRRIFSNVYRNLVKMLFGLKIYDTQVGLKCYRRAVIERVLPLLTVNSFAFDIEMLAVSYHLGFKKIIEAPVEVTLEFGQSSVINNSKAFKYITNMVLDTFKVFFMLKTASNYSAAK